MADNSNIKCNFHNHDYKLYCKKCKDCICMECLDDDLHHMHSFCKLKDARNDILKELQTFIADKGEHNSETADHFSKALKRKMAEFKDTELLIKTQVNVGAEEMIRHIMSSKDELLTSLEKQFYKYNDHIKTAQDSLKTICTYVDNVDPDTTMDDQVFYLLLEMKRCISTCKNILSKDEKPKFVQNKNCKVGYLTNMHKDNNDAEVYCKSDETDINNKQHKCGVSVAVQADYNDSFVANEPKVNQEESSSDEIQKDYPAITINFEKEEGEIGKIIPISDRDAWVLTSKKLKKIKNLVLESTTYAKADDFVVLKDGSVLVLNHDDRFIKKLLPGGRLVPFSFMDSYYPRSLCLAEKSVFINLCYFDCNNTRIVLSKMNSFDFDGIMSSTWDLSALNLNGSPESVIYINDKEMLFCILCRYHSGSDYLSTIHFVNQKKKESKPTNCDRKSFQGSFGISPWSHFVCKGICVDKNNTILYSDATYRCVNALNEDMKFKKFVVSGSDYNLESPGPIAIYNDHLWVVDIKKIVIFRYNADEIEIY